MTTPNFSSFSVVAADILDGTTGARATNGQIYGCRSGSLQVQTGTVDNTGDDKVLESWMWFDYANIVVESGFISMLAYSVITGNSVISSGASPNDYFATALWSQASLNRPTLPVRLRTLSKDSAHNVRTQDYILYAVQFNQLTVNGPAYKTNLLASYNGKALLSTTDEAGNVLANPAIGRLVNAPGSVTGTGASYGVGSL